MRTAPFGARIPPIDDVSTAIGADDDLAKRIARAVVTGPIYLGPSPEGLPLLDIDKAAEIVRGFLAKEPGP